MAAIFAGMLAIEHFPVGAIFGVFRPDVEVPMLLLGDHQLDRAAVAQKAFEFGEGAVVSEKRDGEKREEQ